MSPARRLPQIPEHLVSVLTDRVGIGEMSAPLVNRARQGWMTVENLHTRDAALRRLRPAAPADSGGMVRCRSIYDAWAMDDPVARRIIRRCTESGNRRGCCRWCR
jgi:hypothetical protein